MAVRGAMRRNYMPLVMQEHPNRDAASTFNDYTVMSDNPEPYLANAIDQVQSHYGPATQALGNVMARRFELRNPGHETTNRRLMSIFGNMQNAARRSGVDPNDVGAVLDFAIQRDRSEETAGAVDMIRQMMVDRGGDFGGR